MTVVETERGKVRGVRGDGLERFLGIPYAAAPTGRRRFRPPALPPPWSGVRDVSHFGPEAPQPREPGLSGAVAEPAPQSEDCLSLNVWTPATDGARRPVLVWIHGGGFTTGSASRPLYDGAGLARRGDVVVVSANYRLGVLGLLTHPSLVDEASGAFGGWGLLDQIAALRWVRDHAERFGGDPDRVTVFGESAGGASVGMLCIAPAARGLFRCAIAQSGSPWPASLEQAVEAAEALFAALGVGSADRAALERLEVEALLKALDVWRPIASRGLTAPRPALDGVTLPLDPLDAIDAGSTSGIEAVVGTTRDETKLFLIRDPRRGTLDDAGLERRLARLLDVRDVPRVVGTYREARGARGESTGPWELWCAMQTDRMIRAPALRFAARHAARGGSSRSYLFTWESPAAGGVLGACHALELPFCFGTLDAPGMRAFAGAGPEADRLSARMQDAWLSLARGEGGATEELGPWPAYDPETRATRIFGRECGTESAPREPERAIWDELRVR